MNRSILGRVFGILLLFYAVAFAGFFVYSLASLRPDTVIPSFRVEFAARKAFILFIDNLIPVHVSAVMVAFSLGTPLGARRSAGGPSLPFHRLVSPALVLFIVLGVGYSVLFEGVMPGVQRGAGDLQQLSANARLFKDSMEKSRKAGEFEAALQAADLYLAIDPRDAGVRDARLSIQAEAAGGRMAANKPAVGAQGEDRGAASLIAQARAAYDEGRFIEAHDLATRAHTLEPERTDALRIAALAWNEAAKKTIPRKQEEEASAKQYSSKKEAYLRLMSDDPFAAYYTFVQLAIRYPKDPDITEYLAQSRRKVIAQTFFLDEIDRALSMPATRNILFVNSRGEGRREVFSFDSMVESREGTYFMGIEAIRFRPGGGIDYHLVAPSGKLQSGTLPDGSIHGTILLRGVHRSTPGIESLPVYVSGGRAGAERTTLTLFPEPAAIRALTVDQDRTRVGLPDLWRLRGELSGYGVPRQQISAAIAMKVVMPFLFLTLSFLAVSLGWAFRARYLGRPPFRMILLVPLIPLAASLASLLWIHGHRVLLGFVVLAFGLSAALVVCALAELVVLVVAVILLAGQSVA